MAQSGVAPVSGRTGETCQKTGPYQSNRNAKVTVFINRGQRFPPDTDGAPTTWILLGG
jgi:hypothetical protein